MTPMGEVDQCLTHSSEFDNSRFINITIKITRSALPNYYSYVDLVQRYKVCLHMLKQNCVHIKEYLVGTNVIFDGTLCSSFIIILSALSIILAM